MVSWSSLQGVLEAWRSRARAERRIPACPVDGEPLRSNINGVRYCQYCGRDYPNN